MYKIRNKTSDPRKFREHKTGQMYFLRAGEEMIISNLPATKRFDVFEIINLDLNMEEEQPEKPKKKVVRRKKKTYAKHME